MRMNGRAVVLCGGKACCPELVMTDDGKVEIKDDNGNKIRIEKDQAKLITKAIDKLDREN